MSHPPTWHHSKHVTTAVSPVSSFVRSRYDLYLHVYLCHSRGFTEILSTLKPCTPASPISISKSIKRTQTNGSRVKPCSHVSPTKIQTRGNETQRAPSLMEEDGESNGRVKQGKRTTVPETGGWRNRSGRPMCLSTGRFCRDPPLSVRTGCKMGSALHRARRRRHVWSHHRHPGRCGSNKPL